LEFSNGSSSRSARACAPTCRRSAHPDGRCGPLTSGDLVMTKNWRRCAALVAALTASFALSVPAQSVPAQAASNASQPPGAAAASFQPLPNLPVNACDNSTLPQDYGTNFPVPNDPNGFGFANQ